MNFKPFALEKKPNTAMTFNIDGTEIHPEDCVKLLGVTIDYQLKFKQHKHNTTITSTKCPF